MKRIKLLAKLPSDSVWDTMPSPLGELTFFASSQGLHAILWQGEAYTHTFVRDFKNRVIVKAKGQIAEYFKGERKAFDLPLCIEGTTFQKKVWQVLQRIPYGETLSYGEQAERLGDKNKARAVGAANGLNPLSIVVPCHRVVGKNGSLTGFAGGLENKAFLLELERRGQTRCKDEMRRI